MTLSRKGEDIEAKEKEATKLTEEPQEKKPLVSLDDWKDHRPADPPGHSNEEMVRRMGLRVEGIKVKRLSRICELKQYRLPQWDKRVYLIGNFVGGYGHAQVNYGFFSRPGFRFLSDRR